VCPGGLALGGSVEQVVHPRVELIERHRAGRGDELLLGVGARSEQGERLAQHHRRLGLEPPLQQGAGDRGTRGRELTGEREGFRRRAREPLLLHAPDVNGDP
jgi:hypothetical protein